MSVDTVIRHVDWKVTEHRRSPDEVGQLLGYKALATYRFEAGDGVIDVTVMRDGDDPRRPAQRMQMSIADASHLIDGLNQIIGQAARNAPRRSES